MLKHAKRTINVLNVTVNTINRCVPSVPKLPLIEVEKSIFSEESIFLNQLQRNFKNNFHEYNLSITSLLLLSRNNVLLQTARAKLFSEGKRYSHSLRILFYSRAATTFY